MCAGLVAFVLAPLPTGCDPREEEIAWLRYAELSELSGRGTRAEFETALGHLDPAGRLDAYFTVDDRAVEVRPHSGDRRGVVRVDWRPSDEAQPAGFTRFWQRIALDAGHRGGAWSRKEYRHFQADGGRVVREGDLAWATVRLIEDGLVAAGKEVHLLRGPPPRRPYPDGVEPGFDLEREAAIRLGELRPGPVGILRLSWLTPLTSLRLAHHHRDLMEEPFVLYNRYELRRRSASAAAFRADVTLSIHWNYTEQDQNGILVFPSGSFLEDELNTTSERFWAFRRALDGTLPRAHVLARALAWSMMRHFDLPALNPGSDRETGANWRVVDVDLGVYGRNLAITRRTPGIVLLLEGPCVNQSLEYPRLQGTEVEVDGQRYPARVRQYADAVLEVLLSPSAGS